MPRRTREEALETRSRILNESLRIFCEKNFSNVSIKEIADAVGMTKGAVYWHFRSKNDILVTLIEELCAEQLIDTIKCHSMPGSSEKMKDYYIGMLKMLRSDKRYKMMNKLILQRNEWPSEVQEKVREIVKKSFNEEKEKLNVLLAEAQAKGKIRGDINVANVAEVFTAVFRGLGIQIIGDNVLPEDFTDHLDFLFDAMKHELEIKEI